MRTGIFKKSYSNVTKIFENKKPKEDNLDESQIRRNQELNRNLQLRKEKLLKESDWNVLLLRDKLRLVDTWSIISILANLTQILGSIYAI